MEGRRNLGINITGSVSEGEASSFSEKGNNLAYSRNAIVFDESGNTQFIVQNEPSNKLCIDVKIEGKPANIVGIIYLYDDKWAIFSTLNTEPTDNDWNEIGIMDKSTCCYTPVIRCKCLNFSIMNPIRGVARLMNRQNYVLYWADGYNPDRVLDLGNTNLWDICNPIDPKKDVWLNDFENIPYRTEDKDPKTACIERYVPDPLDIDCNRLSLTPKISIPCPVVKKGKTAGTIPNGLYAIAVAYATHEQIYGNWFISQVAHVYSPNGGNSLDIYINGLDTNTFTRYSVALISIVNKQTVARIIGNYSTVTDHINISFIDESTIQPISLMELMTRKPLYETSDNIKKGGKHLIRIAPKTNLDFNYQPLANIIKTTWFVAEVPETYYYDLKTASGSYQIESDIMGYLRDEVYAFYIRWVYDTGDYSSFYHIPAPPFNPIDCSDDKLEQKNNAQITANNLSKSGPDGSIIIAEGIPGTYKSTETYPIDKPDRWNFTPVKDLIFKKHKVILSLPYSNTNDTDYNLCAKNIRLHRMPDETLDSTLELYKNGKVRYLGVKFDNIYRPIDADGNFIENVVGFEIWRAVRGANKTIIAKGVLAESRGYNYTADVQSNNPGQHNAIFHPFPGDDDTNADNPFLGITKITPKIIKPTGNNPFVLKWNLTDKDTWLPYNKYNNVGNIRKEYVYFHSPETTFRYPYLNGQYYKYYGDVYGDSEVRFVPQLTDLPKTKILSISDFSMMLSRSTFAAFRVLNGSYEIKYGGHSMAGNLKFTATADAATVGGLSAAAIGGSASLASLLVLTTPLIQNMSASILPVMAVTNWYADDIINTINDIGTTTYSVMSILGAADAKFPEINRKDDGLMTQMPKDLRAKMFVPMYFMALMESFYNYKESTELGKPLRDYAVTPVNNMKLHKFNKNGCNNICNIFRIDDSIYLLPYLYSFDNLHVNHIHRTQCILSKVKDQLCNKSKIDNSLLCRVYNNPNQNCCVFPDNKITQTGQVESCIFNNQASLRYVAYKVPNGRPYGNLFGQRKYKIGCYTHIPNNIRNGIINYGPFSSNDYFGGDTYISRYTEKDRFPFFYNLPLQTPDGFEYNYLFYRNILYPRFWINTQKQALSNVITELMQAMTIGQFGPSLLCSGGIDCEEQIKRFYAIADIIGLCRNQNLTNIANQLQNICKIKNALDKISSSINTAMAALNGFISTGLSSLINGVTTILNAFGCSSSSSCSGLGCIFEVVKGIFCFVAFVAMIAQLLPLIIIGLGLQLLFSLIAMIASMFTNLATLILLLPTLLSAMTTLQYCQPLAATTLLVNYNLDGCSGIKCYDDRTGHTYSLLPDVHDMYMYPAIGIVRDFFVESSINTAYRINDINSKDKSNFWDSYGDNEPTNHFRPLKLFNQEMFAIEHTMDFSTFENIFNTIEDIQPYEYNLIDADKAYKYDPRLVVYSLPVINPKDAKDNWRIYLPLNYAYYDDAVTTVEDYNGNGMIVFFKHKPPIFYPGTERLQMTTGRELIIGTGGLFAQSENTASNADPEYQYGALLSRTGVANTPMGIYFMSPTNRRMFAYGSGLTDLSMLGMTLWSNWYMPIYAYEDIDGLDVDNPIIGIGNIVTFDNKYQTTYFIKRDFAVKEQYSDYTFEYHPVYLISGFPTKYIVIVKDSSGNVVDMFKLYDWKKKPYFEDTSWTLSFDPKMNSFISFHDWHPVFAEGSNSTFITVIDNQVWVHHERCDSYCNFYGKGYNFEVELRNVTQGLLVNKMTSIEFYLEAHKFEYDCKALFHKLDYFWDKMIVWNTEQCSGEVKLKLSDKRNPYNDIMYPKFTPTGIEALYSKEEQKYRVNSLFDLIKDRGEFSGAEKAFLVYNNDGYTRKLDLTAIDYLKHPYERKAFRHYINNTWFIKEPDPKTNDIPYKMIVYMNMVKQQLSIR